MRSEIEMVAAVGLVVIPLLCEGDEKEDGLRTKDESKEFEE